MSGARLRGRKGNENIREDEAGKVPSQRDGTKDDEHERNESYNGSEIRKRMYVWTMD